MFGNSSENVVYTVTSDSFDWVSEDAENKNIKINESGELFLAPGSADVLLYNGEGTFASVVVVNDRLYAICRSAEGPGEHAYINIDINLPLVVDTINYSDSDEEYQLVSYVIRLKGYDIQIEREDEYEDLIDLLNRVNPSYRDEQNKLAETISAMVGVVLESEENQKIIQSFMDEVGIKYFTKDSLTNQIEHFIQDKCRGIGESAFLRTNPFTRSNNIYSKRKSAYVLSDEMEFYINGFLKLVGLFEKKMGITSPQSLLITHAALSQYSIKKISSDWGVKP